MRVAYSYIRFSTPEQRKGNSLERQLKYSRDYAAKHGLVLDQSLNLRDLGVSAYKGANIEKGALGAFLKAVKDGTVKRGSHLLVESLDRLSRAKPSDQLPMFLNLINAGITIVTLIDGQSYSKDSIDANMGSLYGSLAVMARAHDESLTKSKRGQAAWDSKRLKGQALTGRCPAWLKLNAAKSFEVIDDRRALVGRMFTMCESGIGSKSIAKTFNKEQIPVWAHGDGWHGSYVQKILTNRAVLGEFQPHKLTDGKRIPVGEPMGAYFPAIIDPRSSTERAFDSSRTRRSRVKQGRALAICSQALRCVDIPGNQWFT